MEKQYDGPRSVNSHICDAAVRLLREYTGRGPTMAKATIDRDSVMLLLGDTLTREANGSWSRPGRGTGCCSYAMTSDGDARPRPGGRDLHPAARNRGG